MLAFFMMAKYAIILIRFSRGVAQLVEHWSPKPGVASSSLAAPAILVNYSCRVQVFCFV